MAEALGRLAEKGTLALITKGDLFDQESKLAASGIGDRFSGVEIVSEKSAETYRRLFARYGVNPDEAVMVGNSAALRRSPRLWKPALTRRWSPIGSFGRMNAPRSSPAQPRFRQLASLAELPDGLDQIAAAARI